MSLPIFFFTSTCYHVEEKEGIMENVFLRDDTSYKRDFGFIDAIYNDTAKYIQLQTGAPFEKCLEFAKRRLNPKNPKGFKDPKALVLKKDKVGDRFPATTTFMSFIKDVERDNFLLSPSMAAYMREEQEYSRHARYIEEGVKNRKRVKKEMMVAKQNNNFELAAVKNGEQQNFKLNNNAYSGATVSTATILYYKSTHSSLTSTCRTATSYANAANEKFLIGNRHYYTPEITKANLVSLINLSNVEEIDKVCKQFNLHYPTPEETCEVINYSTKPYWGSVNHNNLIFNMVNNMTPAERATVCYVADMYHLHKFNKVFVETFLLELGSIGDETLYPTTDKEFDGYDDDIQLLANFLCYGEVKGRKIDDLKKEGDVAWEKIKATGKKALHTLKKYGTLIHYVWLADVVPSSIHAFPSAYRRVAVVSDTDSTMFTMQYWVEQIFGYTSFSLKAKQIVFAIVFLVSEMMMHILAIQSANMGVSISKLRLLAMKNEYYFSVLSMTMRSKHYYASRDAQEGVMFAEAQLEVKGVGLRDSKVPKKINDRAKQMMKDIMNTIKDEQLVDMRQILTDIADIEREIIQSIKEGDYEYLTTGQIKSATSYKQKEESPAFKQYLLWKEVFADSLGSVGEPPYSVVKCSLRAGNRTELEEWCASMKDQKMADRLRLYLKRNDKSDMSTLQIPAVIVESGGIPDDIVSGIDIRKMVFNTMGVFYLMLEALGVFLQDKRITRLVSDFH